MHTGCEGRFGNWENLRVKSCILWEDLVFGRRGYFSCTLASFAKVFLQKAFLALLKINIRHTLSTKSTIPNKCCISLPSSNCIFLSVLQQNRKWKKFVSKVVLLMWEKTICQSEKFLFKLKTEKSWLQRRRENGFPIFARQCVRIGFVITPSQFQKKDIKITIFDRKNVVRILCCGQAGFSISGKP